MKARTEERTATRTDHQDAGALVVEKFAHEEPISSSLDPMKMQLPRR
jgi:hypothetical protein